MTERHSPEKKTPSEKETAMSTKPESATDTQAETSSKASTTPPPRSVKTQPKAKPAMPEIAKQKLSKTAVLALLVAIISGAGVAGVHYLQTLENDKQQQALLTQLEQANQKNQQQMNQVLAEQNTYLNQQMTLALQELTQASQTRIEQLEQQIERFEQNQPSDWLIHEAEYLIRIASRSVSLNQNPTAAINSLKEADLRIKELNDLQYISLRKLIREDVERLKLMPILETDEIVLSLMTLSKQVKSLTLAWVEKKEQPVVKKEVSENVSDWKENLKVTWDNFVEDYFTLRPINADVKPLLSPEYQQNLKENLALKIQLAIWAATEQNPEVYKEAITDVETWLLEFFDMEKLENQNFHANIKKLSNPIINYDYAIDLSSLREIRKFLIDKPLESISNPQEDEKSEQIDSDKKSIDPSEAENIESGETE